MAGIWSTFGRSNPDHPDDRRHSLLHGGQPGRTTTTREVVMRRGWTARTDVSRRLATAGTLIGLMIAGALGSASVAQARDGTSYVDGGYARFQDYGDQFWVCDTKADGYPIVGFIDGHEVWARGGAGTCEYRDYNYPEHTRLIIQACKPWVVCGPAVEVET
jgi:hypothetical protein